MNKVKDRCQKESSAKFYFTSKKMVFELKIVKVILYIAAIIPIVLKFIPQINQNATLSFLYTLISFGLTVTNELLSSFMNNHKEMAILEHQLYEAEITGSTFSKIEYDRESTNNVNELAIRKGLPLMQKYKEKHNKYPVSKVPDAISDDYSYLYLCRLNAASTKYLLSRIFYIYASILIGIIIIFVGLMFMPTESSTFDTKSSAGYLSLIICFYPLVVPFIKDCAACRKAQTQCTKICADIDNFFADGDASIERLARFYYYVQNIEFEMMLARPAIFNIFPKIFKRGIQVLQDGVTYRFIDAINELHARAYYQIQAPRGKELITRQEFDIEELQRKEEARRLREKKKAEKEKKEKAEIEKLIKETEAKKKEEEKKKEEAKAKKALEVKKPTVSKVQAKSASKKADEKTTVKKTETKPAAKTASKSTTKTTASKTSTTKQTKKA